jgi:hypothetical protein
MVENTSQRDPLRHVAGALGADGMTGYIEGMEASGQRQLVASDKLPVKAPWEELEALGFVRGEPVPGDDLFVHCTLPQGWTRAGTGHSMWSKILDERGLERVSVFYKAAFYDRDAHANVVNVGSSLAREVLYSEEPAALPSAWDTLTDIERAEFWGDVKRMADKIEQCPSVYGKYQPRVDALTALI